MHSLTRPVLPFVAAMAAACATPPTVTPDVLNVQASDYTFAGPDTVPGGRVTVRLHNSGTEVHHAQLVRLDGGRTFAEFATILAGGAHGPWPSWARQLGGPNAVDPGAVAEVALTLDPGRYAWVCLIPSHDGVPHFAKGMVRAFTVGPGDPPATGPRADVVMVLDDYRFELSAALRPGRQTIEVTNAATQPHEVVLVALAEGRRMADLLSWLENGEQGPPPGRFIGGVVGLDHGERNWLTLDLEPGSYALICFLPDADDGRMHLEHGMAREIAIH